MSKLKVLDSTPAAKADAEDADCGFDEDYHYLLGLGNEKMYSSARKFSFEFLRMIRCWFNTVFSCVFCGYSIKHGRAIYFRNLALEDV